MPFNESPERRKAKKEVFVTSREGKKRKTISNFSSYAAAQEPGLYTHMFVEDISVGLMGFRHRTEDGRGRVRVEGDDAGKASLNAICTSMSDYSRYDLAETVSSAIESVGTRLAWFGKVVYEVCGSATDIMLASVDPFHLFRVPGGFIQLVPKKDREWLAGRQYAFLPSTCAWVVRIPRRVTGAKSHQRLLAQLTAVSQPAPEFWTRELKDGKIATEFNVSEYNRRRDAYIARLTRRWGWNRRDSGENHHTEFYYFFRSLRFRRAQAILRDHIVDELNRLLVRQEINARIQLQGFLSAAQIDDLIKRALAGSMHYAEAWREAR
jgi:hypothetical protein